MPSFTPKGGPGGGDGAGSQRPFRPPWVKDDQQSASLSKPNAPWARRQQQGEAQKKPETTKKVTVEPAKNSAAPAPAPTEAPNPPATVKDKPEKPILKKTVKTTAQKENGKPVRLEDVKLKTVKLPAEKEKKETILPIEVNLNPTEIIDKTRKMREEVNAPRRKEGSPVRTVLPPPPPPSMPPAPPAMPPAPPPPPPPPVNIPPHIINRAPLTEEKKEKLEALRSRPRRRPDWTDMMKEVETGIRLKHVVCNDRSAPVIPNEKAKGKFVYESEKDNVHNQLLKQIQTGVRLKKVRCNDRSKPVLQGLRKFRRQMTIEEQIQKSASVADVVAVATEPDELDDIDKVRDDLQSSKQMLALELRNKEALERENKRLTARLLNLEAELEKVKLSRHIDNERGSMVQVRTEDDEKLIEKLKEEASEVSKVAKHMEDMYQKTAEELDVTRAKLESAWLHNSQLDMELKRLNGEPIPVMRQPSSKKLARSMSAVKPPEPSSEEEIEEEETETETESEDEDPEVLKEKRVARELKLLASKLSAVKGKRSAALKEKAALKDQFRKLHKVLKGEKKKYKELQKEVDKMAKLLKDVEEDGEDAEEDEDEDEDTDKEEESESESESEDSDDEDEEEEDSEGDLPETASNEEKITNYNRRIRGYEQRLTTLKKSNYLLKVNIDRRHDDLNKQKEMIITLQEDLNSVLAELG